MKFSEEFALIGPRFANFPPKWVFTPILKLWFPEREESQTAEDIRVTLLSFWNPCRIVSDRENCVDLQTTLYARGRL